jgi:hypothetical protein
MAWLMGRGCLLVNHMQVHVRRGDDGDWRVDTDKVPPEHQSQGEYTHPTSTRLDHGVVYAFKVSLTQAGHQLHHICSTFIKKSELVANPRW